MNITERDIRMPEFRDAKLEDLERRSWDGKIVRKDRWETAIRSIRYELGDRRREFEISEIVAAVKAMAAAFPPAPDEYPDEEAGITEETVRAYRVFFGMIDG